MCFENLAATMLVDGKKRKPAKMLMCSTFNALADRRPLVIKHNLTKLVSCRRRATRREPHSTRATRTVNNDNTSNSISYPPRAIFAKMLSDILSGTSTSNDAP